MILNLIAPRRVLLQAFTTCVLLLLACCGAKDYQEQGFGGGYRQQELEPGIWRIWYTDTRGNAETVQTYWLYRAAEFTIANGYDGFEVLSNIQLVDGSFDDAFAPYRIAAGTVFIPIIIPEHPPGNQLEADIRMIRRPVIVKAGRVFDAAILREKLRPIVQGPKCADNNVCPHPHWYIYKP